MPIYEYHCPKCGDFEVMQKMSDKPLSSCPTCRRKVNKLISSTSFQLKGSGWYITDYARKGGAGGDGSGKSAKADDKGTKADDKKSDSGASDSTKSESTKSDTKSDGSSSSKKAGSTKAAAA